MTLDDVFSLLMHFRADESLCRGTHIWNQVQCVRYMQYETTVDLTHVKVAHLKSCMLDSLQPYMFVTPLQLCAWLSDNEGNFKIRIVDGVSTCAATEKETVRGYVQGEIYTYLQVPASTGKSEVMWP